MVLKSANAACLNAAELVACRRKTSEGIEPEAANFLCILTRVSNFTPMARHKLPRNDRLARKLIAFCHLQGLDKFRKFPRED